jgi:hypothetical protein
VEDAAYKLASYLGFEGEEADEEEEEDDEEE